MGSGTGGGYDIFSRLIAPYLAKTLGTTVIVENQPGAGGLIALNRLYVALPDGLQISLSNGTSAAFAQLTGDQAARFDLAKFSYLSTGAPPGLWLVGPDLPIREVKQAIDARMKWRWASSGATSGLGIGAAFTCEALKLDCHVVQGYKGSADAGPRSPAARWTRSMCPSRPPTISSRPGRTGRWRRSRAPSRASSQTVRRSSRRSRWIRTRPG